MERGGGYERKPGTRNATTTNGRNDTNTSSLGHEKFAASQSLVVVFFMYILFYTYVSL